MNELTEKWYVETYHQFIKDAGSDGATLEEARSALAEQYVQALADGYLDRDDDLAEGRRKFDHFVGHERRSKSRTMKKSMERLIDALQGNTILGENDPILDIAFPLGSVDGRDKVLRYWNGDDWTNAALERYDGAAKQTAAAQEFAELAGMITAALASRSAALTGNLFDGGCAS